MERLLFLNLNDITKNRVNYLNTISEEKMPAMAHILMPWKDMFVFTYCLI